VKKRENLEGRRQYLHFKNVFKGGQIAPNLLKDRVTNPKHAISSEHRDKLFI